MIAIMMKNVLFFSVSLALTSCVGVQKTVLDEHYSKNNCNQHAPLNYTESDLPKPLSDLEIDPLLKLKISEKSLNTANAIGLLDDLTAFVKLSENQKDHKNTDFRLEKLELLQKIHQKINIASLEISSVASELDCEEERADQVAQFLKGKEDNTEKNLVIGSIIVGAAGTIAAEVLSNSDTKQSTVSSVAIGASLAEASLGVLMLTNTKKTDFFHPRNALSDIWNVPKVSSYYPASIWYYLNTEDKEKQRKSFVKLLVDEWLNYEQIAESKDKDKDKIYDLYFGKGGLYTSEQLKNRADMMDQVEAFITLMKQDLKELAIEIEKWNVQQ